MLWSGTCRSKKNWQPFWNNYSKWTTIYFDWEPFSIDRTVSNKIALYLQIPIIIDIENVTIAPGQGKTPISLLHDINCEELAFLDIFQNGKFQ